MAESPYWGWSMLGDGGLLDSNLGGVSKSLGLDQAQAQSSGASPGSGSGQVSQFNPKGGSSQNATVFSSGGNQTVGGSPPLPNPGGADSNGYIHADPHWTQEEQKAYEAAANSGNMALAKQINDAAWINYDKRRATYDAIRNSYNSSGSNDPNASGLDYDNATGQWKYYDTKQKKWVAGGSINDIYNTIFNDNQRSEHPLSYYENLQRNQDESYDNDRLNRYRQAQSDAFSSSPTTRYTPTRF